MDLELLRQFYAAEIRMAANVRTPGLARAFATVRRERFLGPGPWLISAPGGLTSNYWETDDADPQQVYHNVAIAIDAERRLNNGQPGSLAMWIDALELKPGGRVLHVGCATGYYSAILAEVVGTNGRLWATDIDPKLVDRARQYLSDLPQAEVDCADGWNFDSGTVDGIFINAGATHPNPRWLDRLAPQGCLVVPLTITSPGIPLSSGMVLKIKRAGAEYEAHFISAASVYPLITGRTEEWNLLLMKAMASRQWAEVRSLRMDEHTAEESCFCHGEGLCISKRQSVQPGEL